MARRGPPQAFRQPPKLRPSAPPVPAFAQAVALHQKGRLAEAERLYGEVLALQPRHVEACGLLGVVRHQLGHYLEALALIERAIRIRPGHAPTHANLANVLLALNRPDDALSSSERALRLDPRCADAHNNRGVALLALRRLDEALASFEQAMRLKPDFVDAHVNRACTLQTMGRPREALEICDLGLRLNASHPDLHNNRGNALHGLDRVGEALASYERAIALNPRSAEAHNNRGVVLLKLARLDDALACFERALALKPAYIDAHVNVAGLLHKMGRMEAALAACDRGLHLRPDHSDLHSNRGNALRDLDRLDEALASYDRAIALKPDYAEALGNRGVTLSDLRRFADALDSFDRAVALKPEYSEAWFGRSLSLLLQGRFAEGWSAYDWRLQLPDFAWMADLPGVTAKPVWRGDDISDKGLLVYAEQGLGDTLQFVRYLPWLTARARRVVFMVQPALLRLLHPIEGVTLVGQDAVPPDFDVRCPLLSLPRIFATDAQTIPATVPYLTADPRSVERWRRRLGEQGPRIGIAWQGNSKVTIDRGRSIPLACFAPLAAIPGVRLISLQKNFGLDPLAQCPPSLEIESLGPDFDGGPGAFLDSAAVMKNLDLVITSDTAVAHLAGALGCETWVALKKIPDWRWQLDRLDSPWYPTMRLFRQQTAGDWDSVFSEIANALKTRIANR